MENGAKWKQKKMEEKKLKETRMRNRNGNANEKAMHDKF